MQLASLRSARAFGAARGTVPAARSGLRSAVRSAGRSRLARLVALALIASSAAGCSALFPPDPVTDRAQATRTLYTIVFVIAVIIFFLVEGLILWAAIRYRRKPATTAAAATNVDGEIVGDPGAKAAEAEPLPPQIHGHAGLELLWTGIPIAIVLFLFVASWLTLNTVQAKEPDPVNITVVGFQWQWEFQYPDPSAPNDSSKTITIIGLPSSPPELHVPVGQTVQITLRGQDVIHSFYVPQFLYKEDAVPGRNNVFQFKVDQIGRYAGQCAEFCGTGHAQMTFTVVAESQADFQSWLTQQREKAAQASAGAGGSGQTLQETAQNIAFQQTSLTAGANQRFSIAFKNNDGGTPHNIAIQDASGRIVFAGSLLTGPGTTTYTVNALPAGTYKFFCQVHPQMTGTLTVK